MKIYNYVILSLALALCPLLYVEAHHTWTGFATVQNEGHHFSGNMTITTSRHNWEITNITNDLNLRCEWEAHHKVKKANDIAWEENMTREGIKHISPGGTASYDYANLANTGDWFTSPGTYTFTAYTLAKVFILKPGSEKADKEARAPTKTHVFTVD